MIATDSKVENCLNCGKKIEYVMGSCRNCGTERPAVSKDTPALNLPLNSQLRQQQDSYS